MRNLEGDKIDQLKNSNHCQSMLMKISKSGLVRLMLSSVKNCEVSEKK